MEQKTAAEMKSEIALSFSKAASLEAAREARAAAFAAEREARDENDRATLQKLAGLRLDLDAPFEAVSLSKVPGAQNGGSDLFRGLAMAREALPIVVDALEYRIKHGTGPDAELARIDERLGQVRAELANAEEKFEAARAEAAAWLEAA